MRPLQQPDEGVTSPDTTSISTLQNPTVIPNCLSFLLHPHDRRRNIDHSLEGFVERLGMKSGKDMFNLRLPQCSWWWRGEGGAQE